jgi:hypothetical protein
MPEVYRQGDVIFRRTNREIHRYAMKESDQLVVTGETGKAHVVNAPVYNSIGQQLLVVEKPTPVEHPDHAIVILPPGTYEVMRTRRIVWPFGRTRGARD